MLRFLSLTDAYLMQHDFEMIVHKYYIQFEFEHSHVNVYDDKDLKIGYRILDNTKYWRT